ncbi:MAG: hypothetical protein R3C05_13870 [Pirellulaceae bacterium]
MASLLRIVDGTSVTFWRTAGISGLASRLLSRADASSLLLLGTGNLSTYIIRASGECSATQAGYRMGRSPDKAEQVIHTMAKELPEISFNVASDLQSACEQADIVVSATGSHEPLVCGDWIRPGTHTDFIGNHHATKRECDTALVRKSKVYADSFDNCFREAGRFWSRSPNKRSTDLTLSAN